MDVKDLRELNSTDLEDQIEVSRKELFGRRFSHATGELENTAGLRAAKRDLARALTVKREREIEAWESGVYDETEPVAQLEPAPEPEPEPEPAPEPEAEETTSETEETDQ